MAALNVRIVAGIRIKTELAIPELFKGNLSNYSCWRSNLSGCYFLGREVRNITLTDIQLSEVRQQGRIIHHMMTQDTELQSFLKEKLNQRSEITYDIFFLDRFNSEDIRSET